MEQLPDTPWHIGYAKKQKEDPRRHRSRCVFYDYGRCLCSKSACYRMNCFGSSHCKDYAEEKDQKEKREIEEIERINTEKYKKSFDSKKKELSKTENFHSYKSTLEIHRCLVCDSSLQRLEMDIKKCMFCGMFYVNVQYYTDESALDIIKAEDVFLMNIPRKRKNKKYSKRK